MPLMSFGKQRQEYLLKNRTLKLPKHDFIKVLQQIFFVFQGCKSPIECLFSFVYLDENIF